MPRTLAWRWAVLDRAFQSGNMTILLTSILFVFEISFLPKYRVNYYDYIIRRLGRRRDRASKRARRNGHDPRLRALARQLKHDHQRAMRKAFWDFIDNLISIDNEDHLLTDKRPPKQKRIFQYIKSLRKECSGVPFLKQGDRLITDTIGKA